MYYYHMIEGWRAKDASIDITFGLHYHSALELYYKARAQGADHEQALYAATEFVLKTSYGWRSDDTVKNRETLVRTVIWYLEEFRDDKATTIILPGGRPAIELTFQFDLGYGPGPGFSLSGHIDRIVEFAEQVYPMDHKTTKASLGPYYFANYSPDNQVSLYTAAGQIVYETATRGVIIDAAQVGVGFSRFDRGIAYRRPSETEEWLTDLKWYLKTAERNAQDNHWPMNDKSCRLCTFKSVCSKEVSFRPTVLASNFVKDAWNPAVAR